MGDNPITTPVSPQRKLPIPANGANTNPALKGILIKPKRILPAQPDNSKYKRSVFDTSPECKADEIVNENSRADYNSSCKSENANKNSLHKVTIPKLSIDVDKLKSHFQLQGKATGRPGTRKTDLNENEINKSTEKESAVPSACQSESEKASSDFLSKNYYYKSDGLNKVKEWCSGSEIDRVNTKMTTVPSETKTLERNIRSPSPKSNTTWDRSSSGYSSDERADPRSPPPSHSASASVSSKAETEVTNDDDILVSNTGDVSESQTDTETENEAEEQLPSTENENSDEQKCKDDNSGSSDSSVTLKTSSNELDIDDPDDTAAQCDNCEANNNGGDKLDATNSCVNFPFDNSAGPKQNSKRSAWTAHSPLPGNNKIIQYRKSGSESMISLRHSSRQGNVENNFDGLEVCGKSFPKAASNNVAKCDSVAPENGSSECSGRSEIRSPTSAFMAVPRIGDSTGSASATETSHIDPSGIEMSARTRFLRQSLPSCRSPRDIKNLGLGSSVKLALTKDDRDIRRTLHDLSSPRRQPTLGKSVPIRARHPIQPIAVFDTMPSQPIVTNVTNGQRSAVSDSGKYGMKHFGKKMWRAPSGQPENAQTRPFSPFGGTLPPAKIREQEKKKHDSEDTSQ